MIARHQSQRIVGTHQQIGLLDQGASRARDAIETVVADADDVNFVLSGHVRRRVQSQCPPAVFRLANDM